MEQFEVHPYSLPHLLQSIHQGDLALPDFQRDFVWDPRMTEELLESIAMSFPAGSLLFMPFSSKTFKPRPVENAPPLSPTPARLILDGQQRLTSLYQACYGVGDARYFIKLEPLLDGGEIEDAVFYRHHKRIGPYKTRQDQAAQLVLPLGVLFGNHGGFEAWLDEVMELRPEAGEDQKALKTRIRGVYDRYIKSIVTYDFPVVVLNSKTELEAVCSIFETLNRTGVKLTVFELLAARFYADDLNLRELWEKTLDRRSMIADFDVDPYYVLQSVALRAAGSCKRSDVLKLGRDAIDAHWETVVRGYDQALQMLSSECGVLTPKWLPYQYLLVPLGACWGSGLEVSGPAAGLNRDRVKQWFWCSALSSTYEFAANSQAARDYNELLRWFTGGEPPQPVADFSFASNRLREITPKQQSVYKAVVALVLRKRPLDFHKGRPLTATIINAEGVDDHHVFPQGFMKDQGVTGVLVDCVLNRTLIDADTNRRIGKRAPSDYMAEIADALGEASNASISELLTSHLLPAEGEPGEPSPLESNDFEAFLDARESLLLNAIELATGHPIVRDPPPSASAGMQG